MRQIAEIAAGALLGLFTGTLTGLSVNPVVATTLGAVLALATAWAGIRGSPQAGAAPLSESARLASFALLGTVGLLAGISVRTHNSLSPQPAEIVQRWTDAGLSAQDAERLAVSQLVGGEAGVLPRSLAEQVDDYRRAGLDDAQVKERLAGAAAGEPMKVSPENSASASVAFAGEDHATFCDGLTAQRPDPEEELRRYRARGGAWAALADALEREGTADLAGHLATARAAACAPETAK